MSVGWNITEHDSVSSTQDILKDMAEKGAGEGNVVVAATQTGGRGRHGREWVSQPDNLYVSLLLRPECKAEQVGQIAILAGLAVRQAMAELIDDPRKLMLKWPNDVLIEGKKCAGILIETSLKGDLVEWVSVGIGVNVAEAPDIGTALSDHSSKDLTSQAVQDFFLPYMGMYYLNWKKTGVFDDIRKAWLSGAHQKGAALSVKIGEDVQNGTFYDLDENGNLLLQSESGEIKTIIAGDVYI